MAKRNNKTTATQTINLDKIDVNEKERVDHPAHYNQLPFEVIEITKHFSFTLGNAIKYICRAGFKSEEGMSQKQKTIEDLKKARWYLDYEIKDLESRGE